MINTPLCLKTWKDSWLLIAGKGFIQVYSIIEKEIMHSWNPNTEDGKKNKVELDVTEMYVLPDYTILCTCTKGYMQIHGFSSPRLRLFQLDNDADINDMEICLTPESIPKDMTTLEIALATEQGVQFVAVHTEGGYEITQMKERHRKSDTVKCLCRIKDNVFLLGVQHCPDLIIYDRIKNQDILKVIGCSPKGNYVLLKQVFPADFELQWHLFVMKDHERLSLIAVDVERRTTEEIEIAKSKGFWGLRESLDLLWQVKKSNHDIKPKYLRIFTT